MNDHHERGLDPAGLTRGLLEALSARARPRAETPAAIKRLKELGSGIREDQGRIAQQIRTRYQERTGALQEIAARRSQRLEAYAQRRRHAVPVEERKLVLAGRLQEAAEGTSLPNVEVRAVGPEGAAVAGARTRTDALGYYRIEISAEELERQGLLQSSLRVQGLDAGGEVLFTSDRAVAAEPGRSEFIVASAEGQRVPASLALGAKVGRLVQGRVQGLQRQHRLLRHAHDLASVPEPGRAPPVDDDRGQPPVGTADAPVIEIRGIGEIYAKRLQDAGVRGAAAVAAMTAERLARMLRTGERHAAYLIHQAEHLLEALRDRVAARRR